LLKLGSLLQSSLRRAQGKSPAKNQAKESPTNKKITIFKQYRPEFVKNKKFVLI
jgi:hypothetical protein